MFRFDFEKGRINRNKLWKVIMTINPQEKLFFLMTILSKTLLSFVRGHFMTFSFFSARHDSNNLNPQPLKGSESIFLINNYKLNIFF